MEIRKPFDPCDLTNITNKKTQERNQRTAPRQTLEAPPGVKPVHQSNSGPLAHEQKDDIEDLFMSLLLGADGPPKQPAENAAKADRNKFRNREKVTAGTTVSPKSHTVEGTISAAGTAGSFSFNVENKLVGAMMVTGQTRDGTCSLQIKLERELESKEKHVLEKILAGNLARVLNIRVEVKID